MFLFTDFISPCMICLSWRNARPEDTCQICAKLTWFGTLSFGLKGNAPTIYDRQVDCVSDNSRRSHSCNTAKQGRVRRRPRDRKRSRIVEQYNWYRHQSQVDSKLVLLVEVSEKKVWWYQECWTSRTHHFQLVEIVALSPDASDDFNGDLLFPWAYCWVCKITRRDGVRSLLSLLLTTLPSRYLLVPHWRSNVFQFFWLCQWDLS